MVLLRPFLLGTNRGATQQYRFAAAEIADDAFRSKAISLVLAGGVVSAVFGAEVAKWSRDLFESVLLAGCYALILVLLLSSAVLLYFVEPPRPATPVLVGGGRPLREIAMEPSFIAAAVAGMIAYRVMSLVMTATPIAMLDCGHEFAAAALVIQWHSLGMFAPSFVTGHLIARLGSTRIMLTGAVLLLLCSLINPSGLGTLNFWTANVALGVGRNFLFVGATTLLTRTYAGIEKGKVQAFNDFLVFGTVTLSSFASGAMLSGAGWIMVQIAVVPFVLIAGVAVLWWRHRDASGTATAESGVLGQWADVPQQHRVAGKAEDVADAVALGNPASIVTETTPIADLRAAAPGA